MKIPYRELPSEIDGWPHAWGLLGQLSFFRYFVVTFRAADFELEINPVQR
ncbi:MAG: hypothetical protein ACRDTT_10900 [Pseudonocardiaceae bacterium]